MAEPIEPRVSDSADPYWREAQTFPRLSPEQARRVAAHGEEEQLAPGALLSERGQDLVDSPLVLDGTIDLSDIAPGGSRKVFTIHRERQFTGETNRFNDRQILASGPTGPTRVVRVTRANVRRLVSAGPHLGEVIMCTTRGHPSRQAIHQLLSSVVA